MARSMLLATCLVLATLCGPAAADPTILAERLKDLLAKLSKWLSGYGAQAGQWIDSILPDVLKPILMGYTNPTFIEQKITGAIVTQSGSLVKLVAPSMTDMKTFLDGTVKPWAVKLNSKCVQDVIVAVDSLADDWVAHAKTIVQERSDPNLEAEEAKFDIRTPFEKKLADIILNEIAAVKGTA